MDEHDSDTFARFARRFAAIEAEVKDPPPLEIGTGTMVGLARPPRSLAAAVAVIIVVVAAVALGPLITSDRSPGPNSSSSATVATSSSAPTATASPPATAVPTVMVGDWSARCLDVAETDCIGSSERFINLLARATAGAFERSGGVLTVEPRPVCPAVPDWADGSYCWQVTAERAYLNGEPWCMVIARRSTDTRYPPYVQVGGPDGAGRAGGMPEGWPSCTSTAPSPSPLGILIKLPTFQGNRVCPGVGLVDAVLRGDRGDPQVAWLDTRREGQVKRLDVVWPIGHGARFTPGLEVVDASGIVVLRDGDAVQGACAVLSDGRVYLTPPFR